MQLLKKIRLKILSLRYYKIFKKMASHFLDFILEESRIIIAFQMILVLT